MQCRLSIACSVALVILLAFSPTSVAAVSSGDVNGSGSIDMSDAVYLLNWLFKAGPAPVPCGEPGAEVGLNGDVNGDGSIDISDPTYLLLMLFAGGAQPAPCKGPDAPHPVRPFDGHGALALASFESFCNNCHGMEPPSPLAGAPSCTSCHTGGSPLLETGCSSCHGNPPDGAGPVGTMYPNLPGAHATHLALASIDGDCQTCHAGAGSGSGLAHFYNRTVDRAAKDGTFDAKAGPIVFKSDGSCGNVSCHGGIDTPNWPSGSISLSTDTDCARCHRNGSALGNPEANSPYSGRHAKHRNEDIGCTTCHVMTGDANHFRFLDTPAIEGPVTYSNPQVSYTASSGRCSGSCHGKSHSNYSW